jgi:hypothetical protein
LRGISGHAPISRNRDVQIGQDSAGEHLRSCNSFGHSQVARVWRAHNQRERRKDFFKAMMWLLALLRIPMMTPTHSDAWRPPVPIDDDRVWRVGGAVGLQGWFSMFATLVKNGIYTWQLFHRYIH